MTLDMFWVDHRPRIDFYVRHGLLGRAPSDEQLRRAFTGTMGGIGERLSFYARNPLLLFPTKTKRQLSRVSVKDNIKKGTDLARSEATSQASSDGTSEGPFADRVLKSLFLFAPARFATQFIFNPWVVVPSHGLNAPSHFQIAHILQTPHPFPLWDLQTIHPDSGALDELEKQVDATLAGRTFRSRLDRALASNPGYFEYLLEIIPKIRQFDYPPVPEGLPPIGQNLVLFLQHAAEL